ncbi:rhamnosyltransferase WsaF family glycosyltransferase [Roseisalinus antarcticus]|uniref:Glycosyl transferase family 2 n=1 Tax=Roseisalinus antarcticus TaxID=254357 RepID=A0A1Y5TPT1_9RHOB|nr:glycosyltransferase [Roseisalinus antarcticus]SLN69153.1 Glycosyl transferase family 2 [Roseisalinus antarcticus]
MKRVFKAAADWATRKTGGPGAPASSSSSDVDEKALLRPHFDPIFYRAANPDLAGSDGDMFNHFLNTGWREGRDPQAGFSCAHYLKTYPDVAESGVNPLLHYVRWGREEGRFTLSRHDLDTLRPHFDPEFYRASNADVAGSDEDLLVHFLQYGWRDGRDPQAGFSCAFYLERYSDIAESGSNPFLHYVLFGRKEGRLATPDEHLRIPFREGARLAPEHLVSVLRTPDPDTAPPAPPETTDTAAMDLHWVIPDFARGSGGHMTIFRMIRFLELAGHRCHIWIETPSFHKTGHEAWETIVKHFQCVEASVEFVENGFFEATGDAVVATGWTTAYLAHRATGFAGKFYFVQDHEPEFYPTGAESLLARQTYDFGLNCICASPWLDRIMSERYGLWARHFHLAYDRDLYRIGDMAALEARFAETSEGPYKIAIYARGHTERRCVPLVLMALELLAAERQDIEVHFFGQDDLPFAEAPFAALNHGVLDPDALAALYNECHVGICMSGTNYSLVPQEMMACGLPLLELNGDSTRGIFPEGVVTLSGPAPQDIAASLGALIDAPDARRRQAAAALDWVAGFSWEGAAQAVEAALTERLGDLTRLAAPAVAPGRDILLDVVIPTYNGMGEIEPVIEALTRQRGADRMQIHCIDSSSSDGTADWLAARPEVSLTVIDQKDFQHGRTRNQGASLGNAPIIAFLTQDALPADRSWGADILRMFNHVPEAAGLFGRHRPYPHHPTFVRDEIERHFANMLAFPLALSRDTDPDRWASKDRGWRQLLHFYSDNNSAMRRDVWTDIPYAEVDYGEDQVWARDIIEAGYTKLYAPTACVYHSHDYGPEETYKRSKTEGAFFYEHFGYELGGDTPEEIASIVDREQRHFRGWAKKLRLGPEEVEMRMQNIAEKHRGWSDGRHAAAARLRQG